MTCSPRYFPMDLVMNRGAMKAAVLLTVLTLLAGCAEKPTAPLDAESGAPVLAANGNGNSGSGKRCQHGGWTRLVTSTGTGFANQGDCVSYSAAGGIVYQTQTLSFAPLADKTFGDPDFTVSATASSGLTVSFSASGSRYAVRKIPWKTKPSTWHNAFTIPRKPNTRPVWAAASK